MNGVGDILQLGDSHMKWHLLVAVSLSLVSCSDAHSSSAAVPMRGGAIPTWDAAACGDDDYQNAQLQRHPGLMGRSVDSLLTAFGEPSAVERFRVGEPTGVFYGAYGKMPKGREHKNAGDPVRVLTWTKNGCNFSIFFLEEAGSSAAVNAFEWAVGADF
jgi:hypothetical protein